MNKTPYLKLEGGETKVTAPCGCELNDEDPQEIVFYMCKRHNEMVLLADDSNWSEKGKKGRTY
jgi:hypothetical protein